MPFGVESQPWLPSMHGCAVGPADGEADGAEELGASDGPVVGAFVGPDDGAFVGATLGPVVGAFVGAKVGNLVGGVVGEDVTAWHVWVTLQFGTHVKPDVHPHQWWFPAPAKQMPFGVESQPWLPSLHGWYVGRLVGALVGALVVGTLVIGAGVVGIHDGV